MSAPAPVKDTKPAATNAGGAATASAAAAAPVATGLDADESDNEPIELVSKEGKKFKVSKKAAMISTLVKTATENGTPPHHHHHHHHRPSPPPHVSLTSA